MTASSLAGHRVTQARVYLPAWGVAWAEVGLDAEVALSGRVELVVSDLRLSATVMSGGAGPKGRSSYRLAAGAGGWGKTVPRANYANDAGVKASTVLADAARACGETLDASTLPSTILGPAWTRDEAPASRTLEHVAPSGWYVGETGITRIGRRPTSAASAAIAVVSVDRARGTVAIASDPIAALVPGVVVEGIEAVDVLHELSGASLRTTVWGRGVASTSRRITAYRRLLEQLDPDRRFRAIYEYRVVTQTGERLNLQPIRVSIGMPDLQLVPVRPGVPGARATHALGSRVLVAFVDASPARPVVVGFEDADGDSFVAPLLELAGDGGLPAARQTDAVQAGPWSGTIIGPCSTKVKVA